MPSKSAPKKNVAETKVEQKVAAPTKTTKETKTAAPAKATKETKSKKETTPTTETPQQVVDVLSYAIKGSMPLHKYVKDAAE